MTRRKSHREFEHERDLPADTASGDHRDRHGHSLRVGDALLRQTEARSADLRETELPGAGVRANADARGDQGRKAGPSKGKVGR
ncbi:MAG: hypothetical protein WD341_10815 [Tistlia sp.]|uniref:hypothetical protein n=1 Tax=Tistlia sp. TaxID=3057121 RepID=UPI0034A15CF8